MGVVAEDVFSSWWKDLGPVEAGGKVGSEEGPDGKGAEEGRTAGECAGVAGRGKEEV